jgi:hypothetical protein
VRSALVLVLAAFVAGCGGSASRPLALLPASALPELKSSTHEVEMQDLAADFGGSKMTFPGFVQGRERVFQGASERFRTVVSRTLEFEDAEAAQAYVTYFRRHLAAAFGTGTNARALESKGRTGYLVDAASCACHRAEPTLAAVVSHGPRVTYLEVNGGGARPAALEALLAVAP